MKKQIYNLYKIIGNKEMNIVDESQIENNVEYNSFPQLMKLIYESIRGV